MPILDISVQLGCATTAVINANPNHLLLEGQILFYTDGVNLNKYYRGDGVTLLSSLPLLGGSGGGGLTVGTTTITSGTNTRILYNNAGVLGEYLVTGTGTTAVLSTSPTFTTDITTPLIIGGTAVGSVIQYKGTSGNGTSTVAAHQFLVGNNGATTAMSVYNSGQFNIGNYASPTAQRIFTIGQDTAWLSIGSRVGSTSSVSFYANQTTPSISNFSLDLTQTDVTINAPLITGGINFQFANNTRVALLATDTAFGYTAKTTGSTITYRVGYPADTGQAALANIPYFKATGNTKTWLAGTVPLQYFNWWSANTTAAVSASNFTLVANGVFDYVQGGTNATNVTSAAIYVPTLALTNTTTGIGLYVVAPSGAATNLAAMFDGNVRINTSNVLQFGVDSVASMTGGNTIQWGTSSTWTNQFWYIGGNLKLNLAATSLTFADSFNLIFNTGTGTKIGTATTQKFGFWNATPAVQPTAVTTVQGFYDAMASIGLIASGTITIPSGGITRSVNNISTNTTAGAAANTDYVYICTSTFTLTLPTAVGNTNRYTVKNAGAGSITVDTTSSQTIDGGLTAVISTPNSIDLISDGANWNVI